MTLLKKINYWILLLFIAICPFLIWPLGTIQYSTMNKLVYLTIVVLLIWIFIVYSSFRQKRLTIQFNTTGEVLALTFLFFILLATLFSQDPSVSYFGSMQKLNGFISWFCYISLFIFAYHFISNEKIKNVLRGMVFVSFFVAVYGILQHHFPQVFEREYYQRSWAFFDNSNHFGTYLNLMLLLGMTLFLLSKDKIGTILYGGINCTLFVAALYSGSRGTWVSIFAGAILISVLIVWNKRQVWLKWISLLALMFFLLIIINFTEQNMLISGIGRIGKDVGALLSEENTDGVGSNRWGIWKGALAMVGDFPILGTGPSTYTLVFSEEGKPASADNAHNDYIEIAYSMGIPTLLLYLGFLSFLFIKGYKTVKKLQSDQEILLYGILITILGYLIKTFFNISVIPVAPFFWVLLGLCYVMITENSTSNLDSDLG